jgi:nucleotide-binding universal stress UspA family protein
MRSILVLAGGSESDKIVFETALAAARPIGGHLTFLHVQVDAGEAAIHSRHVDYARGLALTSAFNELREQAKARSTAALNHFKSFCASEHIAASNRPDIVGRLAVSASWLEPHNDAPARLRRAVHHHDLVVIARPSRNNRLPSDIVERLLIDGGRPVLIAAPRPRRSLSGTVVVCWKETAESARAVGAALPLLLAAERAVIVSADEGDVALPAALDDLVHQLKWNGVKAEAKWLRSQSGSAAEQLERTAGELEADLVVMGAYGHGRVREMIFGGCTRRFLDSAERPVLMMH